MASYASHYGPTSTNYQRGEIERQGIHSTPKHWRRPLSSTSQAYVYTTAAVTPRDTARLILQRGFTPFG
jgi:hypothetical protein